MQLTSILSLKRGFRPFYRAVRHKTGRTRCPGRGGGERLEPSRSLRKVLSPLPAHSIWLTSHVLQLSVCGPSSRMPRLHVAHVWAGASCIHTGACLGRQGGHPGGPPRREAPRWVVLGVCRHSCLCRAPQVQLCDRFTVHECLNMLRGSPDRDVRSGVRQLVCGVVWLK